MNEAQKRALDNGRKIAWLSAEGQKRKSEKMKGENNWNYHREFSVEHRLRISKAQIGREPFNKGQSWDKWMSEEGQKNSLIHLKIGKSGKDHWNWKGGIQKIKRPRETLEYKNWRGAVFEHDDYRCFDCGQKGGKLNADHIYSWTNYPRLRFMVENGRTLCEECHKNTPTFGFKMMWAKRSLITK
jgi:hypothetical protein